MSDEIEEGVCTVCGIEANPLHLCDEDEGAWCDYCWKLTACSKGKHGEDCETVVWS